jgi:hypothetical protein
MTIRIPAGTDNRGIPPIAPDAAGGDPSEASPPSYTERAEPGSIAVPKIEPSATEPGQHPENDRGDLPATSATEGAGNEEPDDGGVVQEAATTTVAPRVSQHRSDGENSGVVTREEPQRAQVTLDPEIADTIRQIAQEQRGLRTEITHEQRGLRTEIEGSRRETFELRVLVKTHEARLGRMFQRIGDVIEDQWSLRAGFDELRKELRDAAGVRGQGPTPTQTPIKSEPISPHISAKQEGSPEPFIVTVSDIESLYASEREPLGGPSDPIRERGDATEQPNRSNERQETMGTPGEEWIRNRNGQHRFGLGTAEALERWRLASEASRERRARGQQGDPRSQRQVGSGALRPGEQPPREQRRSVTQPYEVGFGRSPNQRTPPRSERPSDRGRHPPDGGSSGSSDGSRRGGGGPDRRSGRGSSHTGSRSRNGSRVSARHTPGEGYSSRRRRGRRSPSYSSSSSSLDDWDSEFTVLDDEGRRRQEKRERRRDPRAEYERDQLREIRERIRKMVGHDIQYAATYKGVKDIVTIIKYAGQNDNGIFTRWLDHLLMYFQLNRMCGPDNELVRLSAMYNSLEGVAEEWYRDLILHASRQSWTFEKAVCSLFLTYVFGSAASHAAREFGEVRYSRTEGARKYAQRLKTKARRLARKPDESTMIVRFLAGLPGDLSRRLTLRERLDPARHRFKDFVAKLHELEEAENVTSTVNAAVVDEQRKTGAQGPRRSGRPQIEGRHAPFETQRAPWRQRGTPQPVERTSGAGPAKGKGPSPDVVCFRCQGKGHYASNPACPMYGKDGGPSRPLRDRPQLKAARVSEVNGEAVDSDDLTRGVDDVDGWDDGSQWESATEGDGSLHSHEEGQRINKISLEDISSELEDNDLVYVRAVREKVVAIQKENPSRAAMQPKIDRPRRSKAYESCLAAFVEINGMEAFTLFDSGSSADAISPDFAQVSDARVHTLERPVPLQLGTVGSRASINYGTRTSVALGGRKVDRYYLDVVNIDRYDAILGAPFMREFGVRLDFRSNSVIVGDAAIEALLPEEEAALLKGRGVPRQGGRYGRRE